MSRWCSFSYNSAVSYVGKRVNLHLSDGSVLVNVLFRSIQGKQVAKLAVGGKCVLVPLTSITYADLVRGLSAPKVQHYKNCFEEYNRLPHPHPFCGATICPRHPRGLRNTGRTKCQGCLSAKEGLL